MWSEAHRGRTGPDERLELTRRDPALGSDDDEDLTPLTGPCRVVRGDGRPVVVDRPGGASRPSS